jgi:hypothetical protein
LLREDGARPLSEARPPGLVSRVPAGGAAAAGQAGQPRDLVLPSVTGPERRPE